MTATSAHRRASRRERGGAPGGAPGIAPPVVRCAVYCRKSVDKGNGGEFGSIEAQRDAVEKYIGAHRGEGWVALSTHYDDLGISGATTARPAFQRLLADIKAGAVEALVVYRLDRVSRNQADFIQLLQFFEQHDVKFVSITEHFDTTTPMGRFALGILIQVAQLEREVTAERVHDKVIASRQRGIWTGGRPMLGYDVVNKKLVVNEAEAVVVRDLFALYLKRRSLLAVVDECRRRGITNKTFTTQRGERVQGGPIEKGTLRTMLSNPIFVGRINADGVAVPGAQAAIIDERTWDAVQAMLEEHGAPGRDRPRKTWTVPLKGLVRCGVCGSALTHHTTRCGSRHWSSFVCVKTQKQGVAACPGSRVPAPQMLATVVERLRIIRRDPDAVARTIAACRAEMAAAEANYKEENRQLSADRERLAKERDGLMHAMSKDGLQPKQLASRLAEVDVVLADITARETELQRLGTGSTMLEEKDLRAALTRFDHGWEALLPTEQARLLALLIKSVTFNAPKSELTIAFCGNGIRQLAHPEEKP